MWVYRSLTLARDSLPPRQNNRSIHYSLQPVKWTIAIYRFCDGRYQWLSSNSRYIAVGHDRDFLYVGVGHVCSLVQGQISPIITTPQINSWKLMQIKIYDYLCIWAIDELIVILYISYCKMFKINKRALCFLSMHNNRTGWGEGFATLQISTL